MTDEHPSHREAAIARIQKLTSILEEQYGITPKMGAEIEMIPLSQAGKPAPGLLKESILEKALHPEYFERG